MNDAQLAMFALGRRNDAMESQRLMGEAEAMQKEQLGWARQDRQRAEAERRSANAPWRKALGIGGTVLGTAAGALLAAPTGGMSIPMGAMLGASLGGGLGREIGGMGLPGGGSGQQLTQGMMPMLSYYQNQQMMDRLYGSNQGQPFGQDWANQGQLDAYRNQQLYGSGYVGMGKYGL